MILRRAICIFSLFLFVVPVPALYAADDAAKKQAKDLADKAKNEGKDRAKQVQDYCAAAQLQPKEKKYADFCSAARAALVQEDTAVLASAITAYKNHDLEKAAAQASLISSLDEKTSGEAKLLLQRIANDKLLNQVKEAWARGDLAAVGTLAQAITNPDGKAAAAIYVNNANLYNGYIQQAQKLEKSNPQEAIKRLNLALSLNPKGPGNPAAKIAELQKAAQAKNASKPAADSGAEMAKNVSKLLDDAKTAEKQGKLQDALASYAAILQMQPGNQDAQTNTDRIQKAIKNDPVAAKKELAAAIRFFYQAQYGEAMKALKEYLSAPQAAKDPGAAYFYLGASLIEQTTLETPRASVQSPTADALSAFKEAKKANYKPVRAYVSPALLKVWDTIQP